MIHLFPIEPIEERYSEDWLRWWPKALKDRGLGVKIHHGVQLSGVLRGEAIKTGEFLDAIDTHHYKSTQLANFAKCVKEGMVKDGDIVLLLDGWNPAVTSLRYMKDVSKIDFKIVTLLHAGTWDPHDHLSRCGLGRWAPPIEIGWLMATDRVIVATEFHKQLILKAVYQVIPRAGWDPAVVIAEMGKKITVAGFPLELDELEKYRVPWEARDLQVCFPHRLAPEKQPEVFEALKERYTQAYPDDDVFWIRTQDELESGKPTKPTLYNILGESRVAFSAALQETWGIVQLEAWFLGARPVVPDKLSYCELYQWMSKYKNLDEAVLRVRAALHADKPLLFLPLRDPRYAWDRLVAILESA